MPLQRHSCYTSRGKEQMVVIQKASWASLVSFRLLLEKDLAVSPPLAPVSDLFQRNLAMGNLGNRDSLSACRYGALTDAIGKARDAEIRFPGATSSFPKSLANKRLTKVQW
jgi:hypothetical protein